MIDLVAANRDLAEASPLTILRWATTALPRIALATGFGPEDVLLIDVVARHALPIELFTLDTGLLFAETRVLWHELEVRYRRPIRAVTPRQSVAAQAAEVGPELWTRDPDACCQRRKLAPLADELTRYDAWVTAIRRDQTADRAAAQIVEHDRRFGLIKINPLAAWTSAEVWRYLSAHDVPVNQLHARGYPSIGCAPCTSPVSLGEDPRAGRWRGRAKDECGLHVAGDAPATPLIARDATSVANLRRPS